MPALRIIRIATWSLIVVLVAATAYVVLAGRSGPGSVVSSGEPALGGPFTLVDTAGRTVTEKDLAGRAHALFFGFTHCPDVCPTTLAEMKVLLDELGPDADRIDVYFVTVDPERDTPAVMGSYIASFSDRIRGLSGTPEQVDAIVKAYVVTRRKVPLEDGDYTMDHTASVYLFGADGRFRGTIGYGEPHTDALAKLKRLVSG